MPRILTVAAAQLGPIQRAEPRSAAVDRMVRLMERAHRRGVQLVVFPELALTTFFPRHYLQDVAEADHWFEAVFGHAHGGARRLRRCAGAVGRGLRHGPRLRELGVARRLAVGLRGAGLGLHEARLRLGDRRLGARARDLRLLGDGHGRLRELLPGAP